MALLGWPDFSGSVAGASRDKSLGKTGMPLGNMLSGLEDLGLATAPAADFGRSMALSLLQQICSLIISNHELGHSKRSTDSNNVTCIVVSRQQIPMTRNVDRKPNVTLL